MKVKELIEKLQTLDQELPVMVDGYEGGITEKNVYIRVVSVTKNDNEGLNYYGEHEEDWIAKEPHDLALLISRKIG